MNGINLLKKMNFGLMGFWGPLYSNGSHVRYVDANGLKRDVDDGNKNIF